MIFEHTLSSQFDPAEKALFHTDTSFSTSTPFFRFWTFIIKRNTRIYTSKIDEKDKFKEYSLLLGRHVLQKLILFQRSYFEDHLVSLHVLLKS